jgi:hypothetical protein
VSGCLNAMGEHEGNEHMSEPEEQNTAQEPINFSAGRYNPNNRGGILGRIWRRIEDLAYGEAPEGVCREDWIKQNIARHKAQRESEAASKRSTVKGRANAPRRDEEEDYPAHEYIRDCAEEWGMSDEQVENNLGLDKD